MQADVTISRNTPFGLGLDLAKRRALTLWNDGHSHDSIATELNVSRRTACRYVHESRAAQPHFADADRQSARRELNAFFELPSATGKTIDWLARYFPSETKAVIESLTASQRRTFDGHFDQNMTCAQIAAAEQLTVGAISRRIERIQSKFITAGLPYPVRRDPDVRRVRVITSSRLVSYTLGETFGD
jgi:hypothetical protein